MSIRILLADDHAMFREGLRMVLERRGLTVVGEAENGADAVALARQLKPSIVVMDLSMAVMNGIEAATQIRQETGIPSVLLTMQTEEHYVMRAFSAGLSGYVMKSRAATDLIEAIQEVSQGNLYVSPGISDAVVSAMLNGDTNCMDGLTLRERQVLQLIAEGESTKEIAGMMGVSVRTAESHRARIMEKLNVHEIAGLVRYAIRRGFVAA